MYVFDPQAHPDHIVSISTTTTTTTTTNTTTET